MRSTKRSVVFLAIVSIATSTISPTFKTYLDTNFGQGVGDAVARTDVGGGGSYGGGSHEGGAPTSRQPVIIVHGITNNAGNFDKIRDHFLSKGYTDEDIYGTTYGDSGKTNVLFVTMECSYVKHIRMFIQAVASYTGSKVDILGFSMGSPIARKAILGGACVDTGEQLGPPLTDLVDTFVGIAGANYGSFLCFVPFGSCNMVNGMSCLSRYLNDINARRRYEGAHIFTIYSTGDDKVGYQACGKIASAIEGQDQAFQKQGLNHDGVMYGTVDLQYNLMTGVLLFFLVSLSLAVADRVDVNTTRGPLFGYSVDYGSNTSELYYGRADVFLGIPYVMQPIGPLRFHKPRKIMQFPGVTPYNATKYGNICPQLDKPADMTMGEDCLYLNIISPNVSTAIKYPVMVWIHGGAMKNGFAAQYGVKGAIRNLVSRGVVVVIIQYRIGTLGFFTTFTEEFPPNLGMLDQVEALKFIKEEIANFGGDPYRITLFGQSAGGASVSAHLYSPLSQGLFQQGIMESGTVLTCFDGSLGFANLSEQRAAKYCNVTDAMFKAKDFGNLKSCMMDMDYNKWLADEMTNPLGWKIVQDDHFFPEVPRVQQAKRPNVPVLIGSNKDEWAFFEMAFMKAGITWDLYSRDAFETMFGAYATFLKEHELEIEKLLEDVYRPYGTKDDDALGWLKITNDIFTSAGFTGFISRDIDWYLRRNNTNVYAYEYTRASLVNQIVPIPGWNPVFHCAELAFIWMQTETWNKAVKDGTVTPEDIAMANWFGETWTNFAKYGFPTLDNSWKPVTADNPKAYLEINDEKGMRNLYRGTDRVVWNNVIPSLVGYWPPERPNGITPTKPSE